MAKGNAIGNTGPISRLSPLLLGTIHCDTSRTGSPNRETSLAKCPHCESTLTELQIEELCLKAGAFSYVGVAYVCPKIDCAKIISVQMDPIVLNSELAADLKRKS